MMLDTLVNSLKRLVLNTVLKNEDDSLQYETFESIKRSDLYIACIEHTVNFNMFDYNRYVLEESSIDPIIIDMAINNRNAVPVNKRDIVLENMRNYYIDNYEELNNYYRTLNGLPDINTEGIKIYEPVIDVDISKYLHEMTNAEIDILEARGIMDELIQEYPDKEYLVYIKNNKINIYTARRAQKFAMLYMPTITAPAIATKYKKKLEKNRIYCLKTIYSEAYKFNSDYYDKFIEILIKIQALVDVVIELPEIIIKRDLFDNRTIRDMFESHGITYFDDIPRKYQISMIKNLNTLLKFKSTTKNMIDICSLFGFNNIELFKYYLLKDRNRIGDQYINMAVGDNIILFVGGLFKANSLEYTVQDGVINRIGTEPWLNAWDYDIIFPENTYLFSDSNILENGQNVIDIDIPGYEFGNIIMVFIGGVYKTEGTDYNIVADQIINNGDADWEDNNNYDIVSIKNSILRKQDGIIPTGDTTLEITIEDFDITDNILFFVGGLLKSRGVEYTLSGDTITNIGLAWPDDVVYDILLFKDTAFDMQTGTLSEDQIGIPITVPGYENSGEDISANYSLKFVKVPIDESVDNYMRNQLNHIKYDDVTLQDPYWDGVYTHDYVKSRILEEEFNIVKSKYLSIDTIYDMSNLSFELSYFFSMIRSNKHLEDNLSLRVKYINQDKSFRLIDLIAYLYVLMYENIGIEDVILDTTEKILFIKGFNFDVDLVTLESWVNERNFTLEELGVSDFVIPDSNIMTFEQLMDVFVRNTQIYNHVIDQMINADNVDIYNVYKKIYESMLITKLNTSIYTTNEGDFAGTYTRFLEARDPVLHQHVEFIRTLSGADKSNVIAEAIGEVLFSLDNYIDTSDFTFLFSNIPSLSSELLKGYVYKIINFFKSYKTELMSINTIYRFDDELDNRVIIIDDVYIESVNTEKDEEMGLHFADNFDNITSDLNKRDDIIINDSIIISYF